MKNEEEKFTLEEAEKRELLRKQRKTNTKIKDIKSIEDQDQTEKSIQENEVTDMEIFMQYFQNKDEEAKKLQLEIEEAEKREFSQKERAETTKEKERIITQNKKEKKFKINRRKVRYINRRRNPYRKNSNKFERKGDFPKENEI
jgi:hypothetical protein